MVIGVQKSQQDLFGKFQKNKQQRDLFVKGIAKVQTKHLTTI
jgi:hypothetical protein